jgi:hypothetical protein
MISNFNFLLNKLSNEHRLIEIERKKEENISLNVKICFNKDTLGGSEPTQYSQCFVSFIILISNDLVESKIKNKIYLIV